MFRRTKMTAAMSQELIDELTDHGRRDLSQLRMDDLESDAQLAGAILFPQARALGIEVEATCTPKVERKVVAAGTTSSSREQASEQLRDLADLSIDAKRCERIVLRVGRQRVAEREERLEQYESLPLPLQRGVPVDAPQSSWDHRVAAVMVDGGRGQIRDERWGQPRAPGEKKPQWWRESKVSILATSCSQPHADDPMPEVPENLLDPLWLIPKINEIKAAKGGESTFFPHICRALFSDFRCPTWLT